MRYALRVKSSTLSGYAYLQDIEHGDKQVSYIYNDDPDKCMTWPTGQAAREFKARDDMPAGIGRVVKV